MTKITDRTPVDRVYHRRRAGEAQSMADAATEPNIRRVHQMMADMHNDRALSDEAPGLKRVRE